MPPETTAPESPSTDVCQVLRELEELRHQREKARDQERGQELTTMLDRLVAAAVPLRERTAPPEIDYVAKVAQLAKENNVVISLLAAGIVVSPVPLLQQAPAYFASPTGRSGLYGYGPTCGI